MNSGPSPVHRIELRLREVARLLNSTDPTPFYHNDLDPDAEEFIESRVPVFPPESRFHINIHAGAHNAAGDGLR